MLQSGLWNSTLTTRAPAATWSAHGGSSVQRNTAGTRTLCSNSTFQSVQVIQSNLQGQQGNVASHECSEQFLAKGKAVSPERLQCMDTNPTISGNAKRVKVLSLSNGHGEDVIATRVLEELQALALSQGNVLEIEALPLVGMGHAYSRSGFTTVGPSKVMPSGGFIYMNIMQLIGDLNAGLLSLTLQQWRTLVEWREVNRDGVLIAVGDVFPLALAWLVSQHGSKFHNLSIADSPGYAFIGTAKSEFYIRRNDGGLLRPSMETILFPGSIYLPWERYMMSDARCRLVVPRDSLTVKYLKQQLPVCAQAKVQALGNPMMDGLKPTGILDLVCQHSAAHRLTLLPGSREPEVHANWRLLLQVVEAVLTQFGKHSFLIFTPIVPSIEPAEFTKALLDLHWQLEGLSFQACNSHGDGSIEADGALALYHPTEQSSAVHTWLANKSIPGLVFRKGNSKLFLLRGGFNDCAHWAHAGIAMAGTATEQLVGLGRPVFTIPGNGPQFSYAFAEAQTRLLGKSVTLCSEPTEVAIRLHAVLTREDGLNEFQENGRHRMGSSGAAQKIAQQLWTQLIC